MMPTMNRPLAVSLTALAVTILVAIAMLLPPLAAALFTAGVQENQPQHEIARLMAQHDAQMATYRDRFIGRSVFFKPPQPRPAYEPPKVVRSTPEPVTPAPPPEPVTPLNYRGPTPVAILGDEVHFAGDLRLRLGEEREGVKLIEINAPWSVKLGFSGGEYDVFLFQRSTEFLYTGNRTTTVLDGIQEVPEEKPETNEPALSPDGEPLRAATGEEPGGEAEPMKSDNPPAPDPEADGEEREQSGGEDPAGSAPQRPEEQPRDIPDE